MSTTFFTIVGTSRNASGGIRWRLNAMRTEADIIGYANGELERKGESLQERAGIAEFWDEDGNFIGYSREWRDGEELETALDVLNDDGCTYSIWPDNVLDNVRDFVDEAEKLGLGVEALQMVDKFAASLGGN